MKNYNWIVEVEALDESFFRTYYFENKEDAQKCVSFFNNKFCSTNMYKLSKEPTSFEIFLAFLFTILSIVAVISFIIIIGVIKVYDDNAETPETLTTLLRWLFIATSSGSLAYLIHKFLSKRM